MGLWQFVYALKQPIFLLYNYCKSLQLQPDIGAGNALQFTLKAAFKLYILTADCNLISW